MNPHANEEQTPERPHLVDKQIEDREYRAARLTGPVDEGLLCFSIEAGEELGELYITQQFEAQPNAHDECQTGQNRLLIHSVEWLDQILEQMSAEDAEWDISLRPTPCKKATVKVAADLAVQVAERHVNAEQAFQELKQREQQTESQAVENRATVRTTVQARVQGGSGKPE